MQSLHFWLHCFALWHISSLLFNKPKQVFTLSTLGTCPEQGLEQSQSRTTHFQSESGWGTCRASPQPVTELCLGGNWSPFKNMARLEKKAPELYSSARHLRLLALHLHLHGNSQARNTWTKSTVVICGGRMSILTSLCSHFPGLSQETGGHLDSLMK